MERRRFLTAVGTTATVALAGCSGDSSDENPETEDTTPTPTPDEESTPDEEDAVDDIEEAVDQQDVTETLIEDTATVPEDEYRTFSISLSEQSELELRTTVRDGPAVDIIMVQQSEFDAYSSGERFRFFDEFSQLDTVGDMTSGPFDAGDYVVVIDNTDAVEAAPPTNYDDDIARVEVALEATY